MAIEQTNANLDPVGGETQGYITASDLKNAFIQTYTDLASKSDLSALVPDSLDLTKTYVDAQDALKLNIAGGTMTGPLALSTADQYLPAHAATMEYVDAQDATYDGLKLNKAGGTMTGALTLSGAPTANLHAATKLYVDGGAWTAYTPLQSGWTLGDGTLTGYYRKVGRTVHFRAYLTVGSTTVISGAPLLGLPVQCLTPSTFPSGNLAVKFFDVSSLTAYLGVSKNNSDWYIHCYGLGTNGAAIALSSTVPFTWAAGDRVELYGTFESAS